MKKKGAKDPVDFTIGWGLKGLKISLYCIIAILAILLIFLISTQNSFSEVIRILLQKPSGEDSLAILAGIIIFIAIPFLIGIRVGLSLKTKKK